MTFVFNSKVIKVAGIDSLQNSEHFDTQNLCRNKSEIVKNKLFRKINFQIILKVCKRISKLIENDPLLNFKHNDTQKLMSK